MGWWGGSRVKPARSAGSILTMQVLHEEIFEVFLAAGTQGGFAELGEHQLLERLEGGLAGLDVLAVAGVEGRVAIGDKFLELPVGDDPAGKLVREHVGVHAANVRVEKV